MSSKDIVLRVPEKMFDDLNRIAKNENRPRSRIMREMIERGIEARKKKAELNQAWKENSYGRG